MNKVIIAGGRNFGVLTHDNEEELFFKKALMRDCVKRLKQLISRYFDKDNVVILSGRCARDDHFYPRSRNFASGGDGIGELVGVDLSIPIESYPADWSRNGKAAGPIRNGEMVSAAYKTGGALIALPGGKGTNNIVSQAHKVGLKVIDLRKLI